MTLGSDNDLSQDGAVQFEIPKWTAVNLEIDLIQNSFQHNSMFVCIKPKVETKVDLVLNFNKIFIVNLQTREILHGPSMFAVKAKIYGVIYKQSSSIALDTTSSYWSAPKTS